MSLMSGKEMRFQVPPKTFRLDVWDHAVNLAVIEFQTVRPATEKARVPNVLRRNRGIFSLRRLAGDVGGRKLLQL